MTQSIESKTPPLVDAGQDVNIHASTFALVGAALQEHGYICRISQKTRKTDAYLVNHPDFIKHVLVDNHENYHKGAGFELVKMLMGKGLIVLDGDVWRSHKRMIAPCFRRQAIADVCSEMVRSNLELAETWACAAETGESIDLTSDMNELSLRIILRCLLGDDFDALMDEDGRHPFSIFSEDLARDLKLVARFRGLTGVLRDIIEARRRAGRDAGDFLGQMMASRDEDGQPMSDAELIDETMTLIVAGHETGANTLNWAWYLLSQTPSAEQRMHDEVESACGGDFPDFETIAELTYTRQVIEETLRLYPPVWLFSRRALNDDRLGDYHVPAGVDLFITPYYMHRNAEWWPEPNAFIPDRFDEQNPRYSQRYSYVPFSAGPRRCIGDVFGTIEMQIHLAYFAQRYRLRFEAADNLPVDVEAGVNLRTKHPLRMRIDRRD